MRPIAWRSQVRIQVMSLLTVTGFPSGAAHNWLSVGSGLVRLGNPRFTAQQRPLWLIGHLRVCSGAIQICVVLRHYGSDGFAVDPQCEK
ncbi:UNVERIFIED_CONTAM: hypothetical protein FKN15_024542 [Acipenser sinensis]